MAVKSKVYEFCPKCGERIATLVGDYVKTNYNCKCPNHGVPDPPRRYKLKDIIFIPGTKATPSQGGCWYCHTNAGKMYFSREFDCFLHIECLQKRLKEQPEDKEAEIFAREFGDLLTENTNEEG